LRSTNRLSDLVARHRFSARARSDSARAVASDMGCLAGCDPKPGALGRLRYRPAAIANPQIADRPSPSCRGCGRASCASRGTPNTTTGQGASMGRQIRSGRARPGARPRPSERRWRHRRASAHRKEVGGERGGYRYFVGRINVRHICATGLLSKPSPSFGCLKLRPITSVNSSSSTTTSGSNE